MGIRDGETGSAPGAEEAEKGNTGADVRQLTWSSAATDNTTLRSEKHYAQMIRYIVLVRA
jgi:hypothetical protein